MVWEKSRECEFFLSTNESTDCLGNSVRKLGDSKGPAEHTLNVSENGDLFSWVHEGEWDICTFRCVPLALFQI